MKKVKYFGRFIALVSVLSLGLTGCGGGGSTSVPVDPVDPMTTRDGVFIMYHYPAEVCLSDLLLNELKITLPEATNWLLRVESNDVNCATYGKTDGVDCATEDYVLTDPNAIQYDTSCVVGFDLILAKSAKVIGDTPQWPENISLAAEFAMDAQ